MDVLCFQESISLHEQVDETDVVRMDFSTRPDVPDQCYCNRTCGGRKSCAIIVTGHFIYNSGAVVVAVAACAWGISCLLGMNGLEGGTFPT